MVKSGVHAAAYQACAPKLGSFKQKCSEKNILMPSLKLPNLGAHTRGTFEKHAHIGGSCPPLRFYVYVCKSCNKLVLVSAVFKIVQQNESAKRRVTSRV